MPQPTPDWNTRNVHGEYRNWQGDPISGSIQFTPSVRAIDTVNNIIVLPFSDPIILTDGKFSVNLPVTNDPDITPISFVIRVTEEFAGSRLPYDILVPLSIPLGDETNGGGIDITAIAPTLPVGPATAGYVTSDQLASAISAAVIASPSEGGAFGPPLVTNDLVSVTIRSNWGRNPSPYYDGAGAVTAQAAILSLGGGDGGLYLRQIGDPDPSVATVGHTHAGSGGGIPGTIVDAKGDLIVGTGADTYVRRAVGSNGQVLTADSTTTDGVKWAAATASALHAATHASAGTDDLTTALSAASVPVALGTAAVGGGTGFTRQGHVHPTTGLLVTADGTTETNARIAADNTLTTATNTNATNIATNATAISTETTRATAAEGTNTTAINLRALTSRLISSGTGLTGGGDLSADRTLAVTYGTAASTATEGNDSRFPVYIGKSADTSSALSSITIVNDPHLVTPSLAIGTWILDYWLVYDGGTTGKIKFQVTGQTGSSGETFHDFLSAAATAVTGSQNRARTQLGSSAAAGCAGVGTRTWGHIFARVTLTTAGTISLGAAQAVSNATEVPTVLAVSHMTYQKVA